MISDKKLMQLSLATAVIGIIALYVLVSVVQPKAAAIAGLKDMAGQNVLVSGVVTGYMESKGTVFITLENNSSIKVVMFANDAEKYPDVYKIKEGDNATVKGKVQYYKNELEIIAKHISRQE